MLEQSPGGTSSSLKVFSLPLIPRVALGRLLGRSCLILAPFGIGMLHYVVGSVMAAWRAWKCLSKA